MPGRRRLADEQAPGLPSRGTRRREPVLARTVALAASYPDLVAALGQRPRQRPGRRVRPPQRRHRIPPGRRVRPPQRRHRIPPGRRIDQRLQRRDQIAVVDLGTLALTTGLAGTTAASRPGSGQAGVAPLLAQFTAARILGRCLTIALLQVHERRDAAARAQPIHFSRTSTAAWWGIVKTAHRDCAHGAAATHGACPARRVDGPAATHRARRPARPAGARASGLRPEGFPEQASADRRGR